MYEPLDRAWTFTRRVVATARAENVSFLAGSIAYNAFVSLLPLLVLALLAVSLFGSEALEAWVIGNATAVAPNLDELLREQFLSSGAAQVSLVGLVTLLWGSLKLFRGLDTAFSEVYGAADDSGLYGQVVDGLVVLVAIVAAFGTTVVAALALSLFPAVPHAGVVEALLLFGGLVLAFYPMYYVFPDVDVSVREVLPGVLFAALGWGVLQGLFRVYLVLSGQAGETSLFTSVVVLLTWLYFSGLLFLGGAVVNAVYGGHTARTVLEEAGSADEPTPGARLRRLSAAFERDGRADVGDVAVDDPEEVTLDARRDGRTNEVTVRWTNRGPDED